MIPFINNIDQTILFFIQNNFHFPVLDKIMIAATIAGEKGLIWVLVSVLLMTNRKTRPVGILALAALTLSATLGDGLLKHLIQRPRPYTAFPGVRLLVDELTTYSFPSGHAASSFTAAVVLNKYLKKFSPIFWIAAILIAFSRLYLFMHYPSDIVAGAVLGLLCGMTVSLIYEHRIKNNSILKH